MKILMYADGFGVPTQTFITQDVKYLAQNHELVFVCTIIGSDVVVPNVSVEHIPFKHSLIKKILWKTDISLVYRNKVFKDKLDTIIADFKPDIIHCQFGIEALRFIDNLVDTSIPLVIQFRGYDASRMLQKKSYVKKLREVLNQKNHYSIFVADSLRKNLNHYGINTKNSMILHSGIDLSKFKRDKTIVKKDTITFLQISSLKSKKGHSYTLRAFAKFIANQTSKKYMLKLTGDGEERTTLERLTKTLNIEDNVEFIGFVSHREAKVLLQEADIFVHHSITPDDGDEEGIPNAIMEAMAMELPVISTYHAGIPELVKEGVNGYLVAEKDIEMYARRMQDILKWDKLKINRETIEKEFEINYHIRKLEAFYEEMVLSSSNDNSNSSKN